MAMRTHQKYVPCMWGMHIAVHGVKTHHSNEIFINATNLKIIHLIWLWSGVKNPSRGDTSNLLQNLQPVHEHYRLSGNLITSHHHSLLRSTLEF